MPDGKVDPVKKRVSPLMPQIQKQFQYLKDYTASPKYQERLTKMVNTEKMLQSAVVPERLAAEQMSQYKTNTPTSQVVSGIQQSNQQALDALQQPGKIEVGDIDLGKNVAGGYDSAYDDVRLNEALVTQNPTVPVHEFSHASTGGQQPYSSKFQQEYLNKVFIPPTNSKFEGEVQKPTEVKARLDAIRFLGAEKGLFDAGKTDFTEADWKKLLNDKDIQKDFNFKQIYDQLPEGRKKTGFMWLMNNIAMVDGPSQTENLA